MKPINTLRLILRPYVTDDIEALHKILSDKKTMGFWPALFTIEQTNRWIERSIKSYAENQFGRFAVELKESGKLIGDCGILLSELDGKQENDLGYIIHSGYWGRGYGTEAASASLDYAFNKLGLMRIAANMDVSNLASIRVAEKIGMKKEKEYLNKRNRNLLTYLYAINNKKQFSVQKILNIICCTIKIFKYFFCVL
jgi:RimJ/RimL family protein N-acetyltransferase